MRWLAFIMFTVWASFSYAQNDKSASFKGGEDAYNTYLQNNLVFPEKAIKSKNSREIRVVVEIDTIGKVRIQSFVYPKGNQGFEEEVERFIAGMPNWNPAVHNGIIANSQMVLKFQFNYVDPELDVDKHQYSYYKESEEPPTFYGGLDSVKSFVMTMLTDTFDFKFDTTAVEVQFVVGADSSIIDAYVLQSDNVIPDDYWIYIIRSLPNAIPGRIRNRAVNVQSTLFLELIVESENDN